MLNIRICDTAGMVIARGTCSESGAFPVAVASIYNRALDARPVRRLLNWDTSPDISSHPEGTRCAVFGYTRPRHLGGDCTLGDDVVLDDEVVVHVERV